MLKRHSFSLLIAIFIIFQCASSKVSNKPPQNLKNSQPPPVQLTQTEAHVDTLTNQDQAKDEDENGFFIIALSTIVSELTDSNFYSALIMSFIYSPMFALLAYCISCFITSLIGALYIGKIAFVLPKLVLSYISAVLYIIFSIFTAYLIYTMKDLELATEKTIKKDGEKGDFLNYSQEEQENFLASDAVVNRSGGQSKLGWRKIFSFDLFKQQPFRFFFACILLTIAHLGDDTLRKISDYRSENGFAKVFFGSIIGFIICVGLIALIGFLLKELAFRKFKLSLHNTKVVKYVACGLLVLVGCLNVILDIKANAA